MTLTEFQKSLKELLEKYNDEADNHCIEDIKIIPTKGARVFDFEYAKVLYYQFEIKTVGK